MMMQSEAALVEKVQKYNDMAAFRELVQLHQQRIYYLIRKFVHRHEDTEDLVQDTLMKSLESIDNLKERERFGSWLSSIAVHQALDFCRRRSNRGHVSIDGEAPPETLSDAFVDTGGGDRPLETLYGEEIQRRMEAVLAVLPENHRLAFVHFHYGELKVNEIAALMGYPENTIRSWLFRAIKKLRSDLADLYQTHDR